MYSLLPPPRQEGGGLWGDGILALRRWGSPVGMFSVLWGAGTPPDDRKGFTGIRGQLGPVAENSERPNGAGGGFPQVLPAEGDLQWSQCLEKQSQGAHSSEDLSGVCGRSWAEAASFAERIAKPPDPNFS